MNMSKKEVREFECTRCGAAETCDECPKGDCQWHPPDICTECWDTCALGPHDGLEPERDVEADEPRAFAGRLR